MNANHWIAALAVAALSFSTACAIDAGGAQQAGPDTSNAARTETVFEATPGLVQDARVTPQMTKSEYCTRLVHRCIARCPQDAFNTCSGSCVDDMIDCLNR